MKDYLLAHGQAIAVVTVDNEETPLETWYFDENSMAEENFTTVLRPNELLETDPGRYLKSMTASDWNTTRNKPDFADVAFSGSYNDLQDKLTAGNGILLNSNSFSVDGNEFLSVAAADLIQQDVNSKAPATRNITINGLTQTLESNRSWQVGNVSTDQSYNNPSWLTGLSASKISGLSTVATSGSYSDLSSKPSIPTNTNQLTNGAGFISSVPAQSFSSLTGKPTTLSGYGITDGYSTSNPSAYINQAGARTAISLTTTGTSGASTYDNSTGILNIPNYAVGAPSFNNAAVKTINGAGVQISTTKNTRVSYTITHTIALTLLLSSGSSMVYLEISPNNSTWTSISQAGFSDAVAVAVALNKTSTNNVQGEVPAGWYVRLRAVTSGAGSAAFTVGQETQY